MAPRSIICLFEGTEPDVTALETAIAIARNVGAHLRIVHPVLPLNLGANAYVGSLIVESEWMDMIKRQRGSAEETARRTASALCATHGLPLDSQGTDLPRASFVAMHSPEFASLARELSLCDLIVIGANTGDEIVDRAVPEMALFSTGRPVLVVRPGSKGTAPKLEGGRWAIAWNGSPEAVRALVNSVPLFERAEEVVLVQTAGAEAGQATALDYLAAHGVTARLATVDIHHRSAAEAVLERAREMNCEAIVMGAYGHSVFRERILGGFTADMLNSCELPLLMSH